MSSAGLPGCPSKKACDARSTGTGARRELRTPRIRVARVITRLNVGGPALQAMLLTHRLDPARYETVLACGTPGPREGDMRTLRPEPVAALEIPGLGREISLAADLVAFGRLVALFRRFRPHVVHTHMAKAGLLGRAAARLTGVPVVIHTFHGNVLRGYFDPVRSRAFLALERALGRLSTRVIALSPRQRAEIRSFGIAPDERIVEIPLGIDLAPFLDPPRGRLRAELGLPPEALLVGIVARLVPIKGVDLFVRAAARLASARPDTTFLVVGDGSERDALTAEAAALGIAGRVRFLGWRADLPAIYGDLDVVVLSSRNEGTPISVIEALAAERAVVATAVGGVPDVIGSADVGVLVPAEDPHALAEAVARLLDDPALRRVLGRMGRARVYPQYDAATLVGRIDSLYESLTGRLRAGAS